MDESTEGTLLRIYVGENDRAGKLPLYEALVLKAREAGLAGATMLRGVVGYGRGSVVHTAKIFSLSEELPMVVEIVDRTEKVERFLPVLKQTAPSALTTLEKVRILS